MPVTRRRRPNPDQPENNNHLTDQTESTEDSLAAEQAPASSTDGEDAEMPLAENMPFPPVVPSPAASVPLQAPTHEMSLPLGNLLHLAYNPGYTGSDEARSILLSQLAEESKAGGRARCWNCGSIAIFYDRWNTRSKTFGEIGIAMCEICGVWSVM